MNKRTNFGMRRGAALLFAACFAMGTMPLGCAATDEYAVVASPQTEVTPVEQEFPEDIAANLKICAKAGGSSLGRNSYDVEFEVQVDADHVVQGVKPNGSRLDDAETEACFIKALKELPIDDIVRQLGSVSSTSQLVSPPSRGSWRPSKQTTSTPPMPCTACTCAV